MNPYLSDKEIEDLTRRTRRDAQLRELRKLKIDYGVRSDGSPVVLRSVRDRALGGGEPGSRRERRIEPNWEALAE